MSSDEEVPSDDDRHDFDEDGGEWVGGEFFAAKRQKRRHQTKEEQLYGVFAESDSDERHGGRGKAAATGGGSAFASAPAFVKGNTMGGDQPMEDAQRQRGDDSPRGGLGLGAAGLGFTAGGVQTVRVCARVPPTACLADARPACCAQGSEPMAEDAPPAGLPTAFGQRVRDAAEKRRREADAAARAEGGGGRRGGAQAGAAVPVATFEAHTRGIGSKLLEKMGYKAGQGLGRNGTGIAEALQTKLRPKNMGMGFNDYQEQVKKTADDEDDEQPAADAQRKAAGPAAAAPAKGDWKRSGRAAERRQKRVYRTAEELLREREAADGEQPPGGARAAAASQPVTVIDMRGGRARVVTNLQRLSEAPAPGDDAAAAVLIDATPMPELQHNLRLVVDLTEADIQSVDRRLRQARDTHSILQREVARLDSQAQAHATAVADAQALLDDVTQAAAFAEAHQGDAASDVVAARFRTTQTSHPQAWALYGLARVALAHALPQAAAALAGWRPLEAPRQGVAILTAWRPVLERSIGNERIFPGGDDDDDDAYSIFFRDTALPHMRGAVTNEWEPRDCSPALALFETYSPALPASAAQLLLHGCVLPKLLAAVEAWDPVRESVPVHCWLFPWLPHLGDALAAVYGPVRAKLATALGAWHPSDGSAMAVLAPWKAVLPTSQWESLLQRCILPKLSWALSSQLVINPANQDLQPLHWVLAWAPVLPTRLLAGLLDDHFFPPWHAALRAWLSSPAPNFDDITRWYTGWKGLFPEEVLAQERVRRGFNTALDLMNMAISGQLTADAVPPASMAHEHEAPPSPPPAQAYADEQRPGWSLRDLVERFAEECDVPFLPKPGRTHAGMQVYSFGKLSVVIDTAREALLVQQQDADTKAWKAASIEQLMEMHTATAGRTRA
jgi:tuftelin-interacting protein 11